MFQKINRYIYTFLWIVAIIGLILILSVCLAMYLSINLQFAPYDHFLTKWENDDFELYILDPEEYGVIPLGILVRTSSDEPEIWNVSFHHDSTMLIYAKEKQEPTFYDLKRIGKEKCIVTISDLSEEVESEIFPKTMNLKLSETYTSNNEIPYEYQFEDIRTYKQTEWFAYGKGLNTFSLNIPEDGVAILTFTEKKTEAQVKYDVVFDSENEFTVYERIMNNDEESSRKLYTYKLFCYSEDDFCAVCEDIPDEVVFLQEIYFTRNRE